MFQGISDEPRKELLGNGEWPLAINSSPPLTDPQYSPVVEGTDYNPKMAYKMTAKPRGVAVIINNRYFTCGMKERIG